MVDCDYLFYSNERLPRKLSSEETYDLFLKAKAGSKEAIDEIVVHNIRLVISIVGKKYARVNYDKRELVSIGCIALVKAVNNFDLSISTEFSTYAGAYIDNAIRNFIRDLKKVNSVVSYEEVVFVGDVPDDDLRIVDLLFSDEDLEQDLENEELIKIVKDLVDKLPDRDQQIMKMYFGLLNDGKTYSQQELADKFNISRSAISMLISRVVKKIQQSLEEMGIKSDSFKSLDRNPKRKLDLEAKYSKEDVRKALELLPDRNKKFLTLYLGLGEDERSYTLEEIADMFGISSSSVSKVITTSYQKIKVILEEEAISKSFVVRKR